MALFITGLILLWSLLYPVTDFYNRFLNPAVLRRIEPPQNKLYLTFDDGPDPENTLILLSILKNFGVNATFFLVGEKALRFPELVNQILAEGHEIGLHNHRHRHAYLMFWIRSVRALKDGVTTLQQLTGRKIRLFRPPWGALNYFQLLTARRLDLRLVLWEVNARDWRLETGPERIIATLKRKVRPGAIVVLHDSGGVTGAPQNMLRALPEVIATFKKRGYQYATLSDVSGGKRNDWNQGI